MEYGFQLSPTANDIARSVAAAVAMHVKPKKIALLNENTDAGRDFSRIVRDWFAANAKDVEVAADEFVDRGVTDLTPQWAKIKRTGAQATIGEVYGSSGPVLFNQWFELKVPSLIAHMGATVSAQTFIDQHVKQTDLAIINNRWWPAKYSEVSEPMMAAYKKKTGTDPTNFAVQAHDGTVVGLIGPNGSGKSTIFNLVTGLLRPDEGAILYDGERIDGLATHEIARRGVGRTFQSVKIFRALPIRENLAIAAMGRRLRGWEARAQEGIPPLGPTHPGLLPARERSTRPERPQPVDVDL